MKEKKDVITEKLSYQNLFKVHDVTRINHEPHPYTIGSEHITYANEHHSGMLGTETCENIKCAYGNCHLSYKEHTSDLVCFFKLVRNGTEEEANGILKKLVDELGENYVDGFSFVETEEKFRIT